jgi:phosphoenolpyruvate synthase/pyruvate phosphate dikinase
MPNSLVVDLAEAGDALVAGGKAAALAKMMQAGFNVPEGFVLPAMSSLAALPALQEQLLARFDQLGAIYVAVRSSALNEDGLNATWAGQLDTFLNTDRNTLIQNIERCQASASSVRAQSYAEQQSLVASPVAVIVQRMIQSDVSGVAFSVQPVTREPNQIVIEAGLGLGEAIVSGEVTPDMYIVTKSSQEIVQVLVSQQIKKLVLNDGVTSWQDAGDSGQVQKLTDEQIRSLAAVVVQLEIFFGYPVDVEWALYENKFYILQSRPITTLTVE